jgi:hypothetical protein
MKDKMIMLKYWNKMVSLGKNLKIYLKIIYSIIFVYLFLSDLIITNYHIFYYSTKLIKPHFNIGENDNRVKYQKYHHFISNQSELNFLSSSIYSLTIDSLPIISKITIIN